MELLLRLTVAWLSISIVVISTCWYAVTIIKPRFPNWWKQVVVDDDPFYAASMPPVKTTGSHTPATSITSPVRPHPIDR
jgi:hypothetical protein